MLTRRTITGACVWVPFLLTGSNALAAGGCRDIAGVDFRNRVIQAKSYSGQPYYGVFNGPGPGGLLQLRDGVFLQWDLPPGMRATLSREEQEESRHKPDWKTTIEQDIILHPAPSERVRLLVLFQNHVTGTGSFTYILGFQCTGGSVKNIFETSGEGIKLARAFGNRMEITVGIWAEGDSHCCPSQEVSLTYRWSLSLKRFVRDSPKGACSWLP